MKILKFSSKNCVICKLISPMVKRVCEKHGIDLKEVDVDKHPSLVNLFGAQSLPILIKIDDYGIPTASLGGLIREEDLEEILNEN